MKQYYLVSIRHLRRPLYHHPVLMAVMMHLQREYLRRIDGYSFNLVAGFDRQDRVIPPRTVNSLMESEFITFVLFQGGDNFLNILRP